MEDDTLDMFLKMKPCKALFAVQNLEDSETYISKISEKIDSTYAHTVKIIERFRDMGLVDSEKEGRKKMLTLTEKGSTLAEDLRPFIDDLQDSSEKQSLEDMISKR
jgi:DNA-binding MarR family transcriptional regulator